MTEINFSFNKKSQRYQYLDGDKKGQFIGKSTVRNITQNFITDFHQEFQASTRLLAEGRITLDEWETKIAKGMKTVTMAAYKIAKPDATQSDYGKVGHHLKKQYLYLRNFSRQIAKGELSEAQINARSAQYLQSTWQLYNNATREAHKDSDYKWERRFITSKEPCPQCPKYAALGWQIIGTLPKIGEQCQCKSNCKCYFEFSQSSGKPQESLFNNLNTLLELNKKFI